MAMCRDAAKLDRFQVTFSAQAAFDRGKLPFLYERWQPVCHKANESLLHRQSACQTRKEARVEVRVGLRIALHNPSIEFIREPFPHGSQSWGQEEPDDAVASADRKHPT